MWLFFFSSTFSHTINESSCWYWRQLDAWSNQREFYGCHLHISHLCCDTPCLKLPLLAFVIFIDFHAVLTIIFLSFMQIVHGDQSCSGHVVSFLYQAYRRALPVYLPVYLIPALIVHRQDLLKRWGIWISILQMILFS